MPHDTRYSSCQHFNIVNILQTELQWKNKARMRVLQFFPNGKPMIQTSNLWELTFFPFLDHTIFGLGSPEVWQINDATPPEAPVWSMGVLVNFGGALKKESNKSDSLITSVSVAMYYYISLNKLNYDITSLLDLWELLKTALFQVHVHDSKGICRRHLQCEFHGAQQYSDHKYIQILD